MGSFNLLFHLTYFATAYDYKVVPQYQFALTLIHAAGGVFDFRNFKQE
jgi:hypothetical protein